MMFGWRDEFRYAECRSCGCVQILDPPRDLGRYYPPEYYSLSGSLADLFEGHEGELRRARDRYAVFGDDLVGQARYEEFPETSLRALWPYRVQRGHSVLDVGSGAGLIPYSLVEIGFSNVLGLDPFIDADIEHENGLTIRKGTLHDVEGTWQIIMFHHSFEHVLDPLETLRAAAVRLADRGMVLIRMPTVSSEVWHRYGPDWVQLDAPRHIALHSRTSIDLLARRAGLFVERVIHDSTAFQFWGSEQYRMDIPLKSERSHDHGPEASPFTSDQIHEWELEARELNREGLGDQAAFYLRPLAMQRGFR